MESRHSETAPKVYLLNDLKLVDYSSLITSSNIIDAVMAELVNSDKADVLIELYLFFVYFIKRTLILKQLAFDRCFF